MSISRLTEHSFDLVISNFTADDVAVYNCTEDWPDGQMFIFYVTLAGNKPIHSVTGRVTSTTVVSVVVMLLLLIVILAVVVLLLLRRRRVLRRRRRDKEPEPAVEYIKPLIANDTILMLVNSDGCIDTNENDNADNYQHAENEPLPEVNKLLEALVKKLYDKASKLIDRSSEEYITECYENYPGYNPPSMRSALHIIAGIREDPVTAGKLCRQLLSRVQTEALRQQFINSTVVDKITGTEHSRVAPIHIAAYCNNDQVIRCLCEAGVDVNNSDSIFVIDASSQDSKLTAIYWAAMAKNVKCVRVLIELSAVIDSATSLGETPLYTAAQDGNTDTVKLLLDHNADVNAARTDDGATPLHVAAQDGHTDAAKLLLDHNADVNKTLTDAGATPLWISAFSGHTDAVKLLLDHNADVNVSNVGGSTPLWVAAQKGHVYIIKLLLDHNADVNAARTDDGATPLHGAALNGHTDTVKLLLDHNADVNKRTVNGETPRSVAVANYHNDLVALLDSASATSPNPTL